MLNLRIMKLVQLQNVEGEAMGLFEVSNYTGMAESLPHLLQSALDSEEGQILARTVGVDRVFLAEIYVL